MYKRQVTLPETVTWGLYYAEEVQSPEGYLLRDEAFAVFVGRDGDKPGETYTLEIEIPNQTVKGHIIDVYKRQSLSQAQRLKKCSQEGILTLDMMRTIMSEEKKPEQGKITFTSDKIRKYFPKKMCIRDSPS